METDAWVLYYICGPAQFTSPKGTLGCDSLSKELRTNHPVRADQPHASMTDWHELMQIYKGAEGEKKRLVFMSDNWPLIAEQQTGKG